MKRPLCCVCLAFVAAVYVSLLAGLLPTKDVNETEGSRITLMGELYNKECKNDSLVLYLKHIKKINYKSDQNINYYSKQKAVTEYENDMCVMCYMDRDKANLKNEPKLGAQIIVEGEVSFFSKPANPGEFDAALYYRTLGISFRLFDAAIVREGASYNTYHETLYRLRRYFERVYDRVLSEADAAVLKAMVLGNKTELDAEKKQLFQRSGISHILAISGLHISLIGMLFYGFLKKIGTPRVLSSLFCIALMIAYGDMVGMSSSAYRAVFMFGMKLLADAIGRTYDMLTALSLAAVLLLIEQPLYLYQSGFLLSFGAILGIGLFSEMLKPDEQQMKQKTCRKLASALSGSLSIFLVHFPILLCCYYEFPIYSFLLNLFVIPMMSVLLVLGLFCLACGSIGGVFLGVAKLAGGLCHVLLFGFEAASTISLKLPLAQWIVGRPDHWKIAAFYLFVIVLYGLHVYGKRASKTPRARTFNMHVAVPYWYKLLVIVLAVVFLSHRNICDTSVIFMDVGQGDGIWIESISGKHYLIDGGSTSKSQLGQYTLLPFLKYTGTSKIDAVFLTHLDEDHISGVRELLEGYEAGSGASGIVIDRLILAEAVLKDEAYDQLKALCEEKGIPLLYASAGDRIGDETLYFEVLHPDGDFIPESRNAYSLVLKMTLNDKEGQFNAILTGDVEADGEEETAAYLKEHYDENMHIDLYKAAHHGSKYSNTWDLLNIVRPTFTIISCGEKNRYGHPHAEAVENFERAGSKIAVTKDTGAVTIRIRNGGWHVEYNRSD